MVSTRTQSGVVLKPSSALKRTLDALEYEDSSEDEYQERKAQRSKRRKTTKKAAAAGKQRVASKPGRKVKDLSLLPTMPFDVLYEILGQLGPKDLLSISRTNKIWRRMVVNTETEFLWRGARKKYGAPDPPEDFTEQRWAGLLFETTCECCGKKGTTAVDWLLLRRVCVGCKRNHLMYGPRFKSTFPRQDKDVLNYVPHTFTGVATRDWGYSANPSRFYWDEDVHQALEEMKELRGEKLDKWKQEMTMDIEDRAKLVRVYGKWERHMENLAREEAGANREARLKAVTQRFVDAGYELVDIRKGVGLYSDGVYTGVPYITNAVWTKIRPGLEREVVIRRNQRLDEELRPAAENRMALLRKAYNAYLDRTTRPSERYYFPSVEVFRPIPEVLKVVEADKDTVVTSKDFDPTVDNFDQYVTAYQKEKKESFKALVSSPSSAGIVEYPFNLARHVFRRSNSKDRYYTWFYHGSLEDDILVGWPMVGTHWYKYPGRREIRPGVEVEVPGGFAYNSEASEVSSSLIILAGLEPTTASVADMDTEDRRFVLDNFHTAIGYPVFTWRAAIGVVHILQQKYWTMDDCKFRLATTEEETETKRNEEALRASAKAWACNHCTQFLRHDAADTRAVVIEHLHSQHGIIEPQPERDLFVNERCRHEFERPHEILVPGVEKWKCTCRNCERLGYRRFTKEGITEHVKRAFPYSYSPPVEGVQYLSVASGRDALEEGPDS